MFKEFILCNRITNVNSEYHQQYNINTNNIIYSDTKLNDLFDNYSGCTFNRGLFRIHTRGSSYIWTNIITKYFEKYDKLVQCFAFDWLGRQFAISSNGLYVYMFDPATAEVSELEVSIDVFLNEDLVIYKNETFNCVLFDKLLKYHGKDLDFDKCFGFKVLLFLGGKDEFENYEIIDMDTYWEINYQIFKQINKLPSGKLINKINIE